MQVLLTGGTGFLGNNLLRMLLESGYGVTATTRHSSDPRPFDGLTIETLPIDLKEPNLVSSAVKDVDLVIHSAAMIHLGWTRQDEARRFNVEATRLLAQAARRKKIRMIHVSAGDGLAASQDGEPCDESDLTPPKPLCSYVASKRQAEEAVLEEVDAGLDGVIVNPGFMVGPWDWKPSSGQMMMAIAKGAGLFAPRGGCTVVDVRDVACGILSAIQHARRGERYILGGENLTYRELWSQMAEVVGKRPPISLTPRWANWAAGRTGDLWGRMTGKEPSFINSANTTMGSLIHWYRSDKAELELGYQNGSVEDGLIDAWQWFQQHGYKP